MAILNILFNYALFARNRNNGFWITFTDTRVFLASRRQLPAGMVFVCHWGEFLDSEAPKGFLVSPCELFLKFSTLCLAAWARYEIHVKASGFTTLVTLMLFLNGMQLLIAGL